MLVHFFKNHYKKQKLRELLLGISVFFLAKENQYIYQMQREQYNSDEIYSQGRRVSEYMNLTDILTEKQKEQVISTLRTGLMNSWRNCVV